LGIFLDIPIACSSLSFHSEVYFRKNALYIPFENNNKNYDLIINNSSIYFPIALRYSFLKIKTNPFIQIGPNYSFAIKNEGTLYEYTTEENNTFINIVNSPILQTQMYGYNISLGFMPHYSSKMFFFSEIRYEYLCNFNSTNKLLNSKNLTLNLGLTY
jgi:hypothetical protein